MGVLAWVIVANWRSAHTPITVQAADDVEVQTAARLAVGYHALGSAGSSSVTQKRGPLTDTVRSMTRQVAANAHTPQERLRAVIVIGQTQGGPAALDELDRVTPFLSSPRLKDEAATLRTIYTRGADSLSDEAKQNLTERAGWFGRLALDFNRPPGGSSGDRAISTAVRALFATIVMELMMLGFVLAGIALLTIAIVRLIDRKLPLAYRPPETRSHAGPFLEAFAIYLSGYVGIGYLLHYLHSTNQMVDYSIELVWVAFACVWPLLRGVSWPQVRQGLGWSTGRGALREAGAGITGYLAGMPLMILAIYCTVVLAKIGGERPVHPIVFGGGRGSRIAAVVGLYLLASVWAPIVEETMFRGALFHYLRGRHSWLFAAILSGVIFAALHPQGWSAIPVLAAIGIVFAAIRQWRGSFIASATAHALNNAFAVTMLILVLG
jgi:membrane protease YdiL (CAAX protease family)